MTVTDSRQRLRGSLTTGPRGGGHWRRRRRLRQVSFYFVVPALAVYALVVLYPTAAGSVFAFTEWNGRSAATFIGLDNFTRLLTDAEALGTLRNTVLLAVSVTILQGSAGLALALALHSRIKTRNALRTIFFAPALLPPVIVGFLWQYIYTPGGPLDSVLDGIGLGGLARNWLGDSSVALWSIVVVVIWQHVGLAMVIFLAGLQGVPRELYEAAALDGAGRWRQFRNITLPMIAPAVTVVLSLALISSLKFFDQVFVMTGGGPGYSTQTLSLIMYKQAFVFGNYGYGAAIALALTMIIAFFAFIQIHTLRRLEVEQ